MIKQKTFEIIARGLREIYLLGYFRKQDMESLIKYLASEFKKSNPKFDIERFKKSIYE